MKKKTRVLTFLISVLCLISSFSYAQNDITLNDYKIDFQASVFDNIESDGYYSHKPFHPDYKISFLGTVINSGTLPQTDIRFYGKVLDSLSNTLFDESGYEATIGVVNTLFMQVPNNFNPIESNKYKVGMHTLQNEIDVFPSDNYGDTISFELSELRKIYRHEEYNNRFSPAEYSATGGFAGITFTIPEPDTIVSVEVYIDPISTGGVLIGQLFELSPNNIDWVLILETEEAMITTTGNWLDLEFRTINAGDDYLKTNRRYMIGVEMYCSIGSDVYIGTDSTGHHMYDVESYFTHPLGNTLEEIPLVGVKFKSAQATENISQIANNDVSIYPNPALDKINIDGDNLSEIILISLYDITGKLIFEKYHQKDMPLSLSDIDTGVYLLKIIDKQTIFSEQIIISRKN